MNRSEILHKAETLVSNDREHVYGPPKRTHERIADLWRAYLCGIEDAYNPTPENVICMMILTKIARLEQTPDHLDTWVDIAGYAAIGGEVAQKEESDGT